MSQRGVRGLFWLGWTLAVVPAAVATYLVHNFPGSQQLDSMRFVWHLNRVLPWIVGAGGMLLLAGTVLTLRSGVKRGPKVRAVLGAGLAAFLLWVAYAKIATAVWFQEPKTKRFASGTSPELPATTLVLGVVSGGEAKAYPVRLLAYHHRMVDTLGGRPIWVTYCGMCRTGKVFLPEAAGRPLTFDIIGVIRYNSVYADRETGSYWYQASGRAEMGPLAGAELPELLSDQMSLGEWLALHPGSGVFQPDPAFAKGYAIYSSNFNSKTEATGRGQEWQWVVGVREGGVARSYPWSLLAEKGLVQDMLGSLPLAIVLLADGVSYRVWDRRLSGHLLHMTLDRTDGDMVDSVSGSRFGFDGIARGGSLAGQHLRQVQGSHEYLHSFEGFSGGELYQPAP